MARGYKMTQPTWTTQRGKRETRRLWGFSHFCPAPTAGVMLTHPCNLELGFFPSFQGLRRTILLRQPWIWPNWFFFLRKSFVNFNTWLVTKVLADQSRLINEVQNPCLGQCSKGERARTPPPFGQDQWPFSPSRNAWKRSSTLLFLSRNCWFSSRLSSTIPQARPLPTGQTQIAIAILNSSPSSWQAQRHQSFKM